jgi:DNA modification methylase
MMTNDWKSAFPTNNRYFETDNGILFNCSCLDIKLPQNSIHAVITDPPYGTNDGKGKVIKRSGKAVDFCNIEWDKELPLDWLRIAYESMIDDTWGVIFIDKMAITTVWKALEEEKFNPRNTFYWVKTNKAPTPRCNFKSCVESSIVFTKGRTNRKWRGRGNQNNFIQLPFVSGKEKVKHPTQKPVKLMKHLIELITDEGDIIFDPFIGSGTTAVACEELGRRWIGVELNPDYCEIVRSRLEA